MIGFEINGEFLDLPQERSVELNRNSPLFQQEGFIVEDYTLPVTFPNTPKNMRVLNWPHIVENAERQRPRWKCTLYYNGVPRLFGELRIQRPVNRRVISANFVSGISVIGEDIRERSLRDIVRGEVEIHDLSITKTVTIHLSPSLSERVAISINGTSYEGNTLSDMVDAINQDLDAIVSASFSGNQLTITNSVVGEFEPFYIETPDDTFYALLSGPPQWMQDYKQAYTDFVEEYKGTSRAGKPLRFGTFANFDKFFDEERPLKIYPAVNMADSSGFLTNSMQSVQQDRAKVINFNSMAPMITLDYVLRQIEEFYDITIDFPNLHADDVFFHNWTIDRPIDFYNDRKLILFDRAFDLSQLVPDIQVNDLIKALQVAYNATVFFDVRTRTLHIKNRQAFVRERSYIDITDDATPPSHIDTSALPGIRFKLTKDSGDVLDHNIDTPEDFIVGEGKREIIVGFGTPAMRDHTLRGYWPFGADYPQTTVAIQQSSNENFSFRMARYMESVFNQYLDSRPFFWTGSEGLIENHWKDGILLENEPVYIENEWLMTREQAFNLQWGQKWRIDRSDFLLHNFNVTLRANGLAMADCKFIRVPTFKLEQVDDRTFEWFGDNSSLVCLKDLENKNTGMAAYQFLFELDTTNIPGVPTGRVKVNEPSDPDYIPPFENLDFCPLFTESFEIGKLYIFMTPKNPENATSITINNTLYEQPNSANLSNRVPVPFVMPSSGTGLSVLLRNNISERSTQQYAVYKYRVRSYVGTTMTKSLELFVYPSNKAKDSQGVLQTADIFRTLFFSEAMGDFDRNNYNRLIIEKEII